MTATVISLAGNITGDPELRFTPQGTPVTSFFVAVQEYRRNKETGLSENDSTTFWKCNVWHQYAENVVKSLRKGDHVLVKGTIKDHTFTTREGERRTAKEIDVEEIGPTLRYTVIEP